MKISVDRDHWFQVAEKSGLSAALTRLEATIQEYEKNAFEGEKGFDPELYEGIKALRTLSRDLWESRLKDF